MIRQELDIPNDGPALEVQDRGISVLIKVVTRFLCAVAEWEQRRNGLWQITKYFWLSVAAWDRRADNEGAAFSGYGGSYSMPVGGLGGLQLLT